MNQTLLQMIYFLIYSLFFLVQGRQSFSEGESVARFFTGERKSGVWPLFFTFVGTWVSAATILGFTGNVYHDGTAVIGSSVIPWFIGAGLLYLVCGRLWENDVVSIPELIGKKYDSRGLQILSALVMIGGYVFYLVIQIKGFGIAAASLLNIDYKVAIFLVYLFILYSSFGGFNTVTKTDIFNLLLLTLSIGVLYFVIVGRVEGAWLLTNETVYEKIQSQGMFAASAEAEGSGEIFLYITSFFGWGMGLAANPQYMVRLIAAKDKETAKKLIVYALIFLAFFYFALTQIGLGLRILFPQLRSYCSSDDVFVYAVTHLMQSPFNGFFLISIIGACVSTANSQLLLIGTMLSYDVMAQLSRKKMSEEKILFWTRVFIFAGGTAALIFSIHPPADTFAYGADIWGLFAVVLTPLIYGALCLKCGTKAGAYSAFFVGLAASALFQNMDLTIYWAFPATVCSCLAYLFVSLLERRRKRGEAVEEKV